MDDLGGYIFIVKDVPDGSTLGHEYHQQGHITSGIGQQQGGGHSPHGGPAHVQAGAHRLPPGDVGPLFHHFVDSGGDIHAQIHHRARGADEDGGHEDLGQVQVLIAGVEQALRVGHDGAVNLEQVGEHHAQHAGHQYAQEGPRNSGGAPPVEAVYQGDDEQGEQQRDAQPGKNGVEAFQIEGDQHLPQHEYRQYEGGDGPHSGASGKQDEEDGKDGGQNGLLGETEVVGHGDVGDGVAVIAHHHHGLIPGGIELILFQGAVEHVDACDSLPLKAAAQQFQSAPLFPGAHQAGVNDGGVIHCRHQGGAAVGLLVLKRALKAGGEEEQYRDQ